MQDHSSMVSAKKQSLLLAAVFREWAEETSSDTMHMRADRVATCSDFWAGFKCPACGQYHHMVSYGCRERLCPICAAKLARATAAQALQVLPIINELHGSEPLHWALVTLTQRNVAGCDLNREIDHILDGWAKLRHQKPVKRTLIAWARNLEISYSARRGDYHPHMHFIVAMSDPRYTSEVEGRDWWRDRWQQALDIDYVPVCHVAPMVSEKAVFEVSKYVCKMSSVYFLPAAQMHGVVRVIYRAIFGRRLKSYGGLWLKARQLMRMRAAETLNDLELTEQGEVFDGLQCSCGSDAPMVQVVLVWSGMDYKTMKG